MALLTFQASRGWAKAAGLLILILAASTVAASQSRGAFVGLVAIGLGMLVLQNSIPLAKRIGFIVAVSVSLLIAAPPGYWDLIRSLQDPQEDYNWSAENGRKALMKRGLGYMVSYPLFGVGINNFPMAEGTISSKATNHVAGTGIRWAAAHNTYIQIGAELGLAGMALWLTLIFRGIHGCIKLNRRLPKAWARGDPEQRALYYATSALPVAIFGFAVSSFFVSFAYLELFYVLATILTGLFIFAEEKLKEQRESMGLAPAPRRFPALVRGRRILAPAAISRR
jgi:O-antigen ligase